MLQLLSLMLQPMPSLPPCANDDVYYSGVDNRPQHLLTISGVTTMNTNLKKFSDNEEKAIDGSIAYVEYLLAKRKKKELAEKR